MYGWVWRRLPGRWPLRVGEALLLLAGAVALLFYVVFPAVDPHLPFNRETVNAPVPAGPAVAVPAPTMTAAPTPTPTAIGAAPAA